MRMGRPRFGVSLPRFTSFHTCDGLLSIISATWCTEYIFSPLVRLQAQPEPEHRQCLSNFKWGSGCFILASGFPTPVWLYRTPPTGQIHVLLCTLYTFYRPKSSLFLGHRVSVTYLYIKVRASFMGARHVLGLPILAIQ